MLQPTLMPIHGSFRLILAPVLIFFTLTACGPAAQPNEPSDISVPQPPPNMEAPAPAPATNLQGTSQEEEDPTPTPTPDVWGCPILPEPLQSDPKLYEGQVFKDGLKFQCFPDPTPRPTPKYPELGYVGDIIQFQEDRIEESKKPGGAPAPDPHDGYLMFIQIFFTDEATAIAGRQELKDRGVASGETYDKNRHLGYIRRSQDNYIYLHVTPLLLKPITELEGYAAIDLHVSEQTTN